MDGRTGEFRDGAGVVDLAGSEWLEAMVELGRMRCASFRLWVVRHLWGYQ